VDDLTATKGARAYELSDSDVSHVQETLMRVMVAAPTRSPQNAVEPELRVA